MADPVDDQPTTLADARIGRADAAADTLALDAEAPPAVAAQTAERYALQDEIAVGGMGRVLLADDTRLQRKVAVKMLKNGRGGARQQALFVQECRLLGELEHPNIVPVHDLGTDGSGRAFYAMRYVEGETLAAIIARLRTGDAATVAAYGLDRRVRIVLDVAAALKLAHARGVLHRDVKPDNVLVGRFGEVFLVDWGIATRFGVDGARAGEGERSGTPRYMAPEQVRRERLDPRVDVYALCGLAYELLTTRHALDATQDVTAAAMFDIVTTRAPIPAEGLRGPGQDAVPRGLSLVVMKGLAKDRAERFASIDEFEAALQRWLDGRPPVVCTHTAAERLLAATRRQLDARPRAVLLAGIVTATLAVVGAASVAWFLASL